MAKKFEFRNKAVQLEINGQHFEVELTNEVLLACDAIKEDAQKLLETFKKSKDTKKTLILACNTLVKGIENIIGVGTVEKIFGEKAITLFDLTDIILFINIEVNREMESKINEYMPKNKK